MILEVHFSPHFLLPTAALTVYPGHEMLLITVLCPVNPQADCIVNIKYHYNIHLGLPIDFPHGKILDNKAICGCKNKPPNKIAYIS